MPMSSMMGGFTAQKTPVVMQIIPVLGPGGAEQGCIDIAAELNNVGAKSIVVSHGGSRVPELARAGTLHIDLPVHSKHPLVMWKNIKRIRRLIRDYDVDIVHVRSRAPAWSAWRACMGTQAKFMTTCHAPYKTQTGLKRFYNSSIARGERVIAVSRYVANYLKATFGIDDDVIRVVHRGVALEKFHPTAVSAERMIKISREWRLPDGANVVMMPGRITRLKGHHVLIDAIAQLKRTDVFCVLIGSDQGRVEYRKELEDEIRARKLEGYVRIVDHCSDMPAAYMLTNVVVSASTEPEGFGRVPVEAQAMGRPVVATDHGGVRETIQRGETGWLIPPGDSTALARAISEALALNATQRAVLATRAMAHIAANFTKERMAFDTLNVYSELLAEKFAPAKKTKSAPINGKKKQPTATKTKKQSRPADSAALRRAAE
ncbi:Glycosyltransferase [Micavibrio aeruginosavorus EPB]|uniref:Glycosyltransferase n=2 Tax=Micavibrio aeruginosavorus TaxID=349221 RepID=M4VCE9_9BACT|nr:Glycosyltransferase [Micavibrio aeruginosavorus EPB]